MPDDRALKSWVGDQLHALLGFAEGNLAAYVVGLGASAPLARHPSPHPSPAARRPPPAMIVLGLSCKYDCLSSLFFQK